jgi:pSer/pThr/pTyr-binding forkhead associated (FHA) protein
MSEPSEPRAWLVRRSGASAGRRYPLKGQETRIGRDTAGEVVLDGEEAAVVSGRHAAIRHIGGAWRIHDLNSTNGTYVNGERVHEAQLGSGAVIRLGAGGPEFEFGLGPFHDGALDKTVVASAAQPLIEDDLLSQAVRRARRARRLGRHGETTAIMRDMLAKALGRSARKFKAAIAVLAAALVIVSAYSIWRIQDLKQTKGAIDRHIEEIEKKLETGGLSNAELDAMLDELNDYQEQARRLEDSLFYRFGVGSEEGFIEREIRILLREFGAEQYSVPGEFVEQVRLFIDRYQTSDRAHIERVLGTGRNTLTVIRGIFEQEKLPPDLAYMVLVESAFIAQSESPKGAAGLWQFTPATARAYGMRVSGRVDERLDIEKSTRAASRYVRELILDFGAGSSVMLALAAYNLGPTKVRQAVRRIEDPIKQRNFWYLYRVRALPLETRQYVPKIVAAIIIGRNLERFGFSAST